MCSCGHTAHWHSFGGEGGCEANADCSCTRFAAQPVRGRRYIAVLQPAEGMPAPGEPAGKEPPIAPTVLSVVRAEDYEALEREVGRLSGRGMVDVTEVERVLDETSCHFAGDHLNAGVVVGEVGKRLRKLVDGRS